MRRILYALLFLISFASKGQTLAEAQNYLDRSDYKNAMTIYSQNQTKAKTRKDISLLVESQNGMADCYIDLDANYKALAVLKQNIHLLNSTHSSNYALFAKTHQLLANCYDKLYWIEDYLKESNAFYSYYKKAYPNSEIYKALYYTYLGRYYNMRYLIPKAYYYTNSALKIYHKNKKEAHLIDAYLVYNTHSFTLRNYPGTTQLEKIKYVDSLHYFLNKKFPYDNLKKARVYISITAMDLDNASLFLNNPDFKNLSKGNYYTDKTIAFYNKALAINEKFAGKYYPNSANLNALKGLLFFYKKDYKSTLENYDEGINRLLVTNNTFTNINPMLADLLNMKAWCLDEMYLQNKEVKLLYEIENTLLLMENVWVRYTNEIIKNKQHYNSCGYVSSPYSNLVGNYYKLYKATGQKKYIDLFYKYDEKSKYSALLETLYKEKKSSVTIKKEQLISKLTYESYEDLTLKLNDKLEIKGTKETYKKRFKTHFENYSTTLKQNDLFNNGEVIPLQTVQKNLQENEAIMSYNIAGIQSHYYPYIFLITKFKTQIIDLKPEGDGDAQIPKVESLLLYLNKNDSYQYKKIAFKYYKDYFKKAEQYLPKTVKHIQIVPNSLFANLPFELLLNQETPTNDYRKLAYLGKKYQFSYALSASISRFTNKTVARSNSFSVISPSFDSAQLSELSFAKESAKTIANKYNADLIKDTKATKKSFSEHLFQDKVLTLLSHGKATSDQDETLKGIYLSDGFLSLNEVYNLKSNCEFLILGSCESGEGYKKNKEGNINLARAFSSIGVKSMMLSSWKIDELSSTIIISSFLAYLDQGLTKSEALQRAKMDFLATANPRNANPIYWAGLNITGNNETIPLKKSHSAYWWSLLVFVPITGGFLYYRKKKNRVY